MNKIIKITLIVFVVLIIFFVLNLTNNLTKPLNNLISFVVKGSPDKYCNIDSDCGYKITGCGDCPTMDATNKNWKPFCLIPNLSPAHMQCSRIIYCTKCVNSKCEKMDCPPAPAPIQT